MPPLAIESVGTMPSEFAVHAAYPNPFNPSTRLSFSLPDAAHVTLRLFDVTGRQIETLADEQYSARVKPSHHVAGGKPVQRAATYFARLFAGRIRIHSRTPPDQIDEDFAPARLDCAHSRLRFATAK